MPELRTGVGEGAPALDGEESLKEELLVEDDESLEEELVVDGCGDGRTGELLVEVYIDDEELPELELDV